MLTVYLRLAQNIINLLDLGVIGTCHYTQFWFSLLCMVVLHYLFIFETGFFYVALNGLKLIV